MKKTLIILLILGIIILFALVLFIDKSLTGNIIQESENISNLNIHMYTKAICNSTNFCQDYEITCENNIAKSITPITGAVIQHSEGWQDPRNKEDKEKMC